MGGFTAIQHGAMDGLTSSEQLVFFWLCFHYNRRTKKCCPSQRKLAEESGLHKETVGIALKGLEQKHRIRRRWAGLGHTCYYEIISGRKGDHLWAERRPTSGRNGDPEPEEYQKKLTREQPLKKSSMTPIGKILERSPTFEEIRVDDIEVGPS